MTNYNVVLRKPKTKAAHDEVTKNHQANSILFPGNSYSLEPHLELNHMPQCRTCMRVH